MKKALPQIKLNNDDFKKIKKGKQSIILCLNNEDNKNINIKDKILIVNGKNKLKKKVKNLHNYYAIEDLSKNVTNKQLGFKKKDTIDFNELIKDYDNSDIKTHGLLCIEFKTKKHIFGKIFLGLLIIILLLFSYHFIKSKIVEINVRKFKSTLSDVAKERTDYIFIEINPSLVLTIKDNKVNNIACLNDDCMTIYNELNVKDKNINDSIDEIYNISKEKGFDVSNGVKIKTSNNINIKPKDYITIEYIDNNTEKELLKEIKNNEDIKNINNNDYYTNLWEKLKKDSDYDDIYSCNMNNSELECYIKEDFVIVESNTNDNVSEFILTYPRIQSRLEKIEKVLKKFNVSVTEDAEIPILITPAGKLHIKDSTLNLQLGNTAKEIYYNGRIKCDFYRVDLTKINLLKPDNISYYRDESFYEDEPSSWTITEADEFHITKERDFNYCNEVKCYKTHEITKSYCEYDDSLGYWHWKEDDVPDIYQECDLGYKNCKYVPAEWFEIR